jgi:hypothetical protein
MSFWKFEKVANLSEQKHTGSAFLRSSFEAPLRFREF